MVDWPDLLAVHSGGHHVLDNDLNRARRGNVGVPGQAKGNMQRLNDANALLQSLVYTAWLAGIVPAKSQGIGLDVGDHSYTSSHMPHRSYYAKDTNRRPDVFQQSSPHQPHASKGISLGFDVRVGWRERDSDVDVGCANWVQHAGWRGSHGVRRVPRVRVVRPCDARQCGGLQARGTRSIYLI